MSSHTFHCIKGGRIETVSYCINTIIQRLFSLIYPKIYFEQYPNIILINEKL